MFTGDRKQKYNLEINCNKIFLGNQRSKEEERKIHQVNLILNPLKVLATIWWKISWAFCSMFSILLILWILPLSWVLLRTCVFLTNNLICGLSSPTKGSILYQLPIVLSLHFQKVTFFLEFYFFLMFFPLHYLRSLLHICIICTDTLFTWIISSLLNIFSWYTWTCSQDLRFQSKICIFKILH